jgi:hypothetical protein
MSGLALVDRSWMEDPLGVCFVAPSAVTDAVDIGGWTRSVN